MRYIKSVVIILLACLPLAAQTIQTLPGDPAVKSGTLPNGMSYYVASNPSLKGVADFALVQKTGALTVHGADREDVLSVSRNLLSSQHRLTAPTVQDFFMRLGAMPGRNGFAEVTDNATVFRFREVMLDRAEVLDSALLVIMGMAEKAAMTDDPVCKGWYSPADQAVVIAGDVDAGKVSDKLKMLSYMIPASASLPRKAYQWVEQDTLAVVQQVSRHDGMTTIYAQWRLQRTQREFMNTVQPAIYERYVTEFGTVASSRIIRSLRVAGVPYADVAFDYTDGVESLDDEGLRISVSLAEKDLDAGVTALATALSQLDACDAQLAEVRRARLIYMGTLKAGSDGGESNRDYIDRCISAFVYNSPLTSGKDMLAFHASRDLSDEEELSIFNSIVSATVDSVRNLTVGYMAGDSAAAPDNVGNLFRSSWQSALSTLGTVGQGARPVPSLQGQSVPVKVKGTKKEYMTGGTVWTMSNGFKVMFKHMPSDGKLYYSLALNGGYANIRDLNAGEGAYMSEILKLSRIGGVGAEDFFDAIRRNGVRAELKVDLSTTVLKGSAPKDRLEYLMRILLTVMNDRRTDRDELEYFMDCEQLRQELMRGSRVERICAADSMMCPGYRYSSVRAARSLTGDFADKADKFMEGLAEKMNDGMLVLIGDIDEKQLKTHLQAYVGGFRTMDRSFVRPFVSYQPISGTVRRMAEGEAGSVDITMSVPMSLTSDNYYVAAVASMALRKELGQAISGTGMWLHLAHNCRKDPHERFNLMISLSEGSVEGFLPGTAFKDPVVALNAVRRMLADPKKMDISSAELASYKALLKKHMAERKKDPEYWLDAVTMRYLDGKDFTTGCDARIDAVTADKVKSLLSSLSKGSRVEYIISKR